MKMSDPVTGNGHAQAPDMLRHLGAYEPIQQDQEESFYGNRLIYICWDYHLMFCAPYCLPLPPTMPFGAMVRDVLPELYGDHPEFEQIDWHRTKWFNSKQRFYPDFGKSLEHHGLAHKSLIRFVTPALEGSRQQLSKNQQGF